MLPDCQELKTFELIWRFNDADKYTQLSIEEFTRFHPIEVNESLELWKKYVYPGTNLTERHLSELYARKSIVRPVKTNSRQLIGGEEIEVTKWLESQFPIAKDSLLFFFWHAEVSVKTDWELFLSHWDDFCYPSDDSNIIILPQEDRCIIYIEDVWYIFPLEKDSTVF